MQSPVEQARETDPTIVAREALQPTVDALRAALARETADRRRAECAGHIQSDAVQLALQLLVREPDIAGFFRAFIKALVDQSESHACGVWLLERRRRPAASCGWPTCDGRFYMKDGDGWDTLDAAAQQRRRAPARVPARLERDDRVHRRRSAAARAGAGVQPRRRHRSALVTAPLLLPTRNLGWVALSSGAGRGRCEHGWRRALLEAMAQQATLALHQNRLAEQSHLEARRQAVLEERNRMARDIHDTLAQGFGAILMQLQAAQRSAGVAAAGGGQEHRRRGGAGAHAHGRRAALGLGAAAAAARAAKTSPRRCAA